MERLLLLPVLLVLLGGAAACGGPDEAAPPPISADTWRGEGRHVEVTIHDMHCEGCEMTVKQALGTLDGVADVEADNETDLVQVTLTEAAHRDEVIARIRQTLHDQQRKIVGEDEIPPSE